MTYVTDELKVVDDNTEEITIYWRRRREWGEIEEDYKTTPYPDGKIYSDVSDYEYIGYSNTYVFIWVVYDCYSAKFNRIPRNPQDLSINQDAFVEAG